jgi:hypothetical protein
MPVTHVLLLHPMSTLAFSSLVSMQVFGRAYDIFTARNLEDFEPKSWFDTRRGTLPVCTDQMKTIFY